MPGEDESVNNWFCRRISEGDPSVDGESDELLKRQVFGGDKISRWQRSDSSGPNGPAVAVKKVYCICGAPARNRIGRILKATGIPFRVSQELKDYDLKSEI